MLIKENRCVGCGHCIPFCSNNAIEVFGLACIDPKSCSDCSLCISYCPNDAITED